ncbi:MAG: hypothetical protein Kow0063_30920 [Anaerolineae bacterium]
MTILHAIAASIPGLKKSTPPFAYPTLRRDVQKAIIVSEQSLDETQAASIKIRYLGSVRATTGERELHWHRSEVTLRELLRDLAIRYGPRFRYWVLDRGNQPAQHIIVRVNGRNAWYLDGADTRLHSGDTITVSSQMPLRPTF